MTVGEKGGVDDAPTPGKADPGNQPQADAAHDNGDGGQPNAGQPIEGAGASQQARAEPAVEPEPVEQEDPEIRALKTELETTRASLEQSTARLRTVSKAYKDLQEEMRSFKERMEQRAKQDAELQAFDQVRAFFDPVMNLKRSLAAPGDDVGALRQGLEMVLQQFLEALNKLGLQEVPGVGHPFDPQVHEALGVQPVTDKALDGRVLAMHTAGYTVHGKVLQAAQVIIGKYEPAAGEA